MSLDIFILQADTMSFKNPFKGSYRIETEMKFNPV